MLMVDLTGDLLRKYKNFGRVAKNSVDKGRSIGEMAQNHGSGLLSALSFYILKVFLPVYIYFLDNFELLGIVEHRS